MFKIIILMLSLIGFNVVNAQSGDSTGSASTGSANIPLIYPAAPQRTTSFKLLPAQPPLACTLPWGGSITSGNSVTAFSSNSSNNCSSLSQSRDCIDGNLSGSYQNNACTTPVVVVPPPVIIPPTPTPWYVTNARTFAFSQGSGYYAPGNINVSSNGTFSGDYVEMYCIYQGLALPSDGNNCLYQGSWYSIYTTGVTFVRGDFGFSGNISTAGSGSGNWFRVGGGANGVISFSPSGGGISGQFSNSSGVYIPYTAY